MAGFLAGNIIMADFSHTLPVLHAVFKAGMGHYIGITTSPCNRLQFGAGRHSTTGLSCHAMKFPSNQDKSHGLYSPQYDCEPATKDDLHWVIERPHCSQPLR